MKTRKVVLTEDQDSIFLQAEEMLSRKVGLRITHQELLIRVLKYALHDNGPDFMALTSRQIQDEVDRIIREKKR